MTVFLDGSIVDQESVEVGHDSTLWRGQGWFETMAVKNSSVFNLENHLKRLSNSLPTSVSRELDLIRDAETLRELASDVKRSDGSLKLVVWEEGNSLRRFGWIRSYSPPDQEDYERGVTLGVQKRSHPPRWPLSDQKRTSYASIMAERDRVDAWDVLYCDLQGHVWESGIANIMWYEEGTVFYPPPDGHYLVGTVLEAAVEGARQLGLETRVRNGEWDNLGEFCWLTNSLVGMIPVKRIDTVKYHDSNCPDWWLELRETLLSDRVFPRWDRGLYRG
jgi:branched-subunit amino acid aminotransferase/4-amino-4-deoxychorismate lyase